MLVSEYYKDSVNKSNAEHYEIITYAQNQRTKFTVKCLLCQEICYTLPCAILSGRKPCKCSIKANNSLERKLEVLDKVLENTGIKILDRNIGKAKDPIPCLCEICNYNWTGTFNGLVYKSARCPRCRNTVKRTESELKQDLETQLLNKNLQIENLYFKDKGLTYTFEVDVYCKVCEDVYQTSVACILTGRSCPKCAKYGFQKSDSAVLYLCRVISEESLIIAYKYGVAKNLEQRLQQHNKAGRKLGLHYELVMSWQYELGKDALLHEKYLKKNFKRVFNSFQIPSGSTETILPQDFSELFDIQSKNYEDYKIWLME